MSKSVRVDTNPLLTGCVVVGNTGLGLLISEIPDDGGTGNPFLYANIALWGLVPGDEVYGTIVTQPSQGTLRSDEAGSFTWPQLGEDVPPGSYTAEYLLYVNGSLVDATPSTISLTRSAVDVAATLAAQADVAADLATAIFMGADLSDVSGVSASLQAANALSASPAAMASMVANLELAYPGPSVRVDTTPLLVGSVVCGDTGLGVAASTVPSDSGGGPSYLYGDVQGLRPEDEVYGVITSFPAQGTLVAAEDGSFTWPQAGEVIPSGVYYAGYTLFVNGVQGGSYTLTLITEGQAVNLGATATGASSTLAALSTQIPLVAAAISISTMTAGFTSPIDLDATMSSLSLVNGTLETHIDLSATALATALQSAGLASGISMAATLTDSADLQATLGGAQQVLASIMASNAMIQADLSSSIQLGASPSGQASVVPSLSVMIHLSAAMVSNAILNSQLSVRGEFSQAMESLSSVSGDLVTKIPVTASMLANALMSGSLSVQVSLDSWLSGQSSIQASLSVSEHLGASMDSSASVVAGLTALQLVAGTSRTLKLPPANRGLTL